MDMTWTFSGQKIGNVTSGTFSPILKKGIGMGYVRTPLATIGQQIAVHVRESTKISEVVPTPFYDTHKIRLQEKIPNKCLDSFLFVLDFSMIQTGDFNCQNLMKCQATISTPKIMNG